jgi:hypothetical protein
VRPPHPVALVERDAAPAGDEFPLSVQYGKTKSLMYSLPEKPLPATVPISEMKWAHTNAS